MKVLDLNDDSRITTLDPLRGLTNLEYLSIASDRGITTLEPLKGLPKLKTIDLTGATSITTLEPLKGMKITFKGASHGLLETINCAGPWLDPSEPPPQHCAD